jgi:signal transduction histidine kinase
MILLVLVASVLIAGVTVYQYREQAKDYHQDRLERKEEQIKQAITFSLQETTYPVTTENLGLIFKDEIYRIAIIEDANFNLYDLEGQLIKSSRPKFDIDSVSLCLNPQILNALESGLEKRYVEANAAAGDTYQASYTYILDHRFKPIGILNLPYYEENSFYDSELKQFLIRLGVVYLLLFIGAITLAYFISKYITRSLQTISDKLTKTGLAHSNEKIILNDPSEEIGKLIEAYNRMIDELELSAEKLARSEREQAWREMAKQVAHEIKNPLTPMRLSIQQFEHKFDPSDPLWRNKVQEFAGTLIQQIDTLSSIASAFSTFAELPAQQNEEIDVVKTVKLALDIFNEPYIHFIADQPSIVATMDRTQLIRVMTNLIKNAIQALPEALNPKIVVSVSASDQWVYITVADNGSGIQEANWQKIFEPKFTTKSSGMGLGLGMVKTIVEGCKGQITFTSQEGKGTVFTVKIPRVTHSNENISKPI